MSLAVYFNRLKKLYDSMDRAYGDVAASYGFACTGCDDNCCSTYFFHYTIAEYLYVLRGLSILDRLRREEIMDRAAKMCDPQARAVYLCPLNVDGRCILYPFRPMICRLHGVPFAMVRPDGQREMRPGCDKFERERICKGPPYRRLDRTPFYRGLAELEWEIRQAVSRQPRFRKTIAEMLRDSGEYVEGFGLYL